MSTLNKLRSKRKNFSLYIKYAQTQARDTKEANKPVEAGNPLFGESPLESKCLISMVERKDSNTGRDTRSV